jgi:1-phosphofructokinase
VAPPNGVYIHDRRGGERGELVSVESRPLERYAADELYGIALSAGLDAEVTMVTGCQPPDPVSADVYRRLVSDLSANGKVVIADLTGPPCERLSKGASSCCDRARRNWSGSGTSSESRSTFLAGAKRLRGGGVSLWICQGGDLCGEREFGIRGRCCRPG